MSEKICYAQCARVSERALLPPPPMRSRCSCSQCRIAAAAPTDCETAVAVAAAAAAVAWLWVTLDQGKRRGEEADDDEGTTNSQTGRVVLALLTFRYSGKWLTTCKLTLMFSERRYG